VAWVIASHILDRVGHSFAQIRRRGPNNAGNGTADQNCGEAALPSKLSQAEQQDENRHDDERRARGHHIADVGDEQGRREYEKQRQLAPASAQQLDRLPDQSEGANCKNLALKDVILDRHAGVYLAAPLETGRQHQSPGGDQQRARRRHEPKDHPPRIAAAAKLHKQQRDEKELVESAQPRDALTPTDVGPQHPDGAEHPKQDWQATGGGHELAPNRGEIECRNRRDEPQHDHDAGGRCRPRQ
jgi:hypothetical protein